MKWLVQMSIYVDILVHISSSAGYSWDAMNERPAVRARQLAP